MKLLSDQLESEKSTIINQWFENLPGGVTLACDDHVPLGRCKAHKKQCANQCTCAQNYNNQIIAADSRYAIKAKACNIAYQNALAQAAEKNRIDEEHRQEMARKEEAERKRQEEISKQKAQQIESQRQQQEQFARTQNYIDQQRAQTAENSAKITQSIQEFGTAMNRYFDSRQKAEKFRQDMADKDNYHNMNYLECALRKNIKFFYSHGKYADHFFCFSFNAEPGDYDGGIKDKVGIADTLNYFLKHNDLEKAISFLRGADYKRQENSLYAGSVVDDLQNLYTFGISNDYKEVEKRKKSVIKGKSSIPFTLKYGVYNIFKNKDLDFAALCFDKVLESNTGYFKKTALFYRALLLKRQGITNNDPALIADSESMLKRAYSISNIQFFELQNTQSSDNFLGYFFYPDYFNLMQLAIIQEIADSLYYQYKFTGNKEKLAVAIDYYYDYFDSLNNKSRITFK
ncbi:MAG: hypothetical protein EOP00_10555 [Pedobacter sp.]|nr:MAG: hypothetical protein EOP00_10555 [Pedobacter sp.]